MLDRADCADFGCHNSIRLETKHFLNTLALTFISFSGRFVFVMQKHYLFFFASDPLVSFDSYEQNLCPVEKGSHINIAISIVVSFIISMLFPALAQKNFQNSVRLFPVVL